MRRLTWIRLMIYQGIYPWRTAAPNGRQRRYATKARSAPPARWSCRYAVIQQSGARQWFRISTKHLVIGWAQRDSNPRHLPCKGSRSTW